MGELTHIPITKTVYGLFGIPKKIGFAALPLLFLGKPLIYQWKHVFPLQTRSVLEFIDEKIAVFFAQTLINKRDILRGNHLSDKPVALTYHHLALIVFYLFRYLLQFIQ